MSAVKWTRKSTRSVSRVLRVSHTKAWMMLRRNDYRLRVNRKRLTRRSSPDRDRQFQYINRLRRSFERRGLPIISVDAKKRELVGNFRNAGRTWRRTSEDVNVYDFRTDAEGVAIPYGIYDLLLEEGFVVVGTSHNTAAFAVNAIRLWWDRRGRFVHAGADKLLILADSGSSNGTRVRAWKIALQEFANRTGLRITVAHYPTGASKWNPVEHRLFGPISINWAGVPLRDYAVIRQLVRHTRTSSGARCRVRIDRRRWPTQKEISRKPRTTRSTPTLRIRRATVLPNLNYTVLPHVHRRKCPT